MVGTSTVRPWARWKGMGPVASGSKGSSQAPLKEMALVRTRRVVWDRSSGWIRSWIFPWVCSSTQPLMVRRASSRDPSVVVHLVEAGFIETLHQLQEIGPEGVPRLAPEGVGHRKLVRLIGRVQGGRKLGQGPVEFFRRKLDVERLSQ